jgi:hypothetical protein
VDARRRPRPAPDEAGRRLRKGSSIELIVTYRKQTWDDQGKAFTDRSKLGLFFAREPVDLIVEATQESKTPTSRFPPAKAAYEVVATPRSRKIPGSSPSIRR